MRYLASMHNPYGMVHRTRYLDSIENSYGLARCTEYIICIKNRGQLSHQHAHRTPHTRLTRGIFLGKYRAREYVENIYTARARKRTTGGGRSTHQHYS